MLDQLIKFSLKNRLFVIVTSILLLVYGGVVLKEMPIDVFPDLNRPTVSIMTEARGMAPEEVEALVTVPLEKELNGISGIKRIRSNSGIGLSVIFAEFEWGSDLFRNRQLVAEKISEVKDHLPLSVSPQMGPMTSIMGEVQLVGLSAKTENSISPIDARTYADWIIKPRLQSIMGVSQVIVMGGGVKQFQIKLSAAKLNFYQLTLDDVLHNLGELSQNSTGGFLEKDGQEFLIRNLGRANSIEDVENTVVGNHLGKAILVKEIASVEIDAQTKRGEAGINGKAGVIISITKQPGANTIELTKKIDETIKDIKKDLPGSLEIYPNLFKQANFINHSINNVEEALRDAAIFIAIVLFLFLVNVRTTLITLTAIPLSFILTFIFLKMFNLSINTMTLGGLAIAIGELVDDAIVDVENVLRRLRENHQKGINQPLLKTIFEASSEIRNSIVFATLIVVLVFIPLFYLDGIEGKLFIPLGTAYIVSIISSLLVSLTLTPVLASFILTKTELLEKPDSRFVKWLKDVDRKILIKSLDRPYWILTATSLLFLISISIVPFMGVDFLPKFNEGTAVVGIVGNPGISLYVSNQIGRRAEELLLKIPEVKSVSRRTGRAEQDEHAEGVHSSEIDVDLKEGGRPRDVVLSEMRKSLSTIEGVGISIGQPISHRLDHLLSGVKAALVIKVFGPDLNEIRKKSFEIKNKLISIKGLVDLQVEQQALVPQIKISLLRDRVANLGLPAGKIIEVLERTLNGEVVSQVLEEQKVFNVFMRFDEESRSNLETISNTIIKILPSGKRVKLSDVADVYEATGPNVINRENGQRRGVIMANIEGRDVESIKKEINQNLRSIKLKSGYFINYDGQLEAHKKSLNLMLLLGLLSILAIFVVLYMHFNSWQLSLQVMINIPLALIGSIWGIQLTGGTFSLASLVAFITLCGIASRNGIMMISHYLHLMKYENEKISKEMIIRGSLERLVPVLMTALTAMLALLPILFSKDQPGKEILYPLSVVIVGGLLSSTLLDIIVTPTLFYVISKNKSSITAGDTDDQIDNF